jgi:hypothetical protein
MEPPSLYAIKQVRLESETALELEMMNLQEPHESLALKKGDRVFLLTIEGEFPSRVVEDWNGWNLLLPVKVTVDCNREAPWIQFHRSAFRVFTALDLIADV